MKSEFNHIGSEYHWGKEEHQPRDPDTISFSEISPPAAEFAPCAHEFLDSSDVEEKKKDESSETDDSKKRKQKRKQEHSIRQMSYLVTSVIAAVAVSSTLNGGTIVENVQSMGGATRGDLRFSIQWNDEKYNANDLDAHCMEPGGYDIFFGNAGYESPSGGVLDVDIVHPDRGIAAVENIVYSNREDMEDGVYELYVHCFSQNGGTDGFRAEVAIRGRVYKFDYKKSLSQGEYVAVAKVTVQNGKITIEELLD